VDPRQENLDLWSNFARLTELSSAHAQKITLLTGKLESLRSEREEIEKYQAELAMLTEQLAQANDATTWLQTQQSPPLSDEQRIDEIGRQLNANMPEVSDLEVTIRELHAEFDRTEDEIGKYSKKCDDLLRKLAALKEEVARVRSENSDLAAREANDLELVEQARQAAAGHLKEASDAKKDVEKQINAMQIETGKLQKQFALLKPSEEAALQANRDSVKNVELSAEPRTLGIDVARRDQRRAENRAKVHELYEQFVRIREEGGELAELRRQLVALRIKESSIESGELQEEDDSELTADELIQRIGKIRKKRNAMRAEVAVLRGQTDEVRGRVSDTRWRIEAIKKVIDSLMSQQVIRQIAVKRTA
jgi:chromosome segregation ATPase